MIDTDKYERMTMNDMEHLELWEFSRKLFAEVKRLREELQKVCSHLDYSMTMTGAVCNVCGLEEGDEE